MTDISVIAGATRAALPRLDWIPSSARDREVPRARIVRSEALRFSAGAIISLVFMDSTPPYSRLPAAGFVASIVLAFATTIGLLAAPSYASDTIVIGLLFGLALGLGGMALSVGHAVDARNFSEP